MIEQDRARERADTWPTGQELPWSGMPWLVRPTELLRSLGASCRDAVAIDFGPGRVVPWVPVAFGLGVAIYFSAGQEPAWPAAAMAAGGCATLAVLARRRPIGFPIVIMIAAVAMGFAITTLRTALIAHPILDRPVFGVGLSGFIEVREERERSDRIIVKIHHIDGRLAEVPERVRLSVRRGMAPAVGAFVTLKARLSPPLSPLRPGSYDFARDLYFQRIGAVGFVTGAIKVETPPAPPGFWLRCASVIDSIREAIDRRIRQAAPGDSGSIASALITGKRDAISAPVNDAMYISSLAHVLSISGYHMAVVAGVVFFVFRAGLALAPAIAARYPIKKWGAAAALLAAAFYLVLSGAEVATQRAFIMTAIVLIGVMADRAALTLRTLAVAAAAVLLLAPEAVVHPSFQMSFAATLALVAAYERGLPWALAGGDTSLGARVALWGVREIAALIFASLVAGLATMPYAAFHFHRAAPYGVLANLLAMPIVSAWVMPAGLVALIAMPFGFDAAMWRAMSIGIDWMIAVAVWVASLPGAVGRVPAFGVGALLLGTAGLIALCLLRSWLRWAGAVLLALGCVIIAATPRPDVLVSASGDAVAVRTTGGRLAITRIGNDPLALRDWLAADGDARRPDDLTLNDGFACDDAGCIARLADHTLVAVARSPEALAEDCARTKLVITTRGAPPDCAATVINRDTSRTSGAVALRRNGVEWTIDAARPPGSDRPWARQRGNGRETPPNSTSRLAPRDATPSADDLEAGD